MDRLEEFIKSNSAKFDALNPDPRLWNQIEARLPQKEARRISIWKITSVAAIGLVLVLSGVIVGLNMNSGNSGQTAEYLEFREAEQYYSNEIAQRVSQLSEYQYDEGINKDLEELQEVYDQLTTELEDGLAPNKNDIIEALIQNYQTRVELLERVLERLDEGKNQMELTTDDEENVKI